MDEVDNEEYQRNLSKWSRAAKRILGDKDFMEVLDVIEGEHFLAFKNMPLGATLDEYKTVHLSLVTIQKLIARLEAFIHNQELEERRIEIDEQMKDVDI